MPLYGNKQETLFAQLNLFISCCWAENLEDNASVPFIDPVEILPEPLTTTLDWCRLWQHMSTSLQCLNDQTWRRLASDKIIADKIVFHRLRSLTTTLNFNASEVLKYFAPIKFWFSSDICLSMHQADHQTSNMNVLLSKDRDLLSLKAEHPVDGTLVHQSCSP